MEAALADSRIAEVTGGGPGMGRFVVDMEVDEERFDEALQLIRKVLAGINMPESTRVKRNNPVKLAYAIFD